MLNHVLNNFIIFALVALILTLIIGYAKGLGKDCPYFELEDMPNIPKRRSYVANAIRKQKSTARIVWATAVFVCFAMFVSGNIILYALKQPPSGGGEEYILLLPLVLN
jgi:hypothetical protein